MSFWRKILGKKSTVNSSGKPSGEKEQVVRPERVKVVPRHGIRFIGDHPFRQTFELANISVSGMALIVADVSAKPLHGMKVFGHLLIGEDSYLVKAEIRHIHHHLLGCQFVSSREELRKAIGGYLHLEILGVKLRQVNSRFVKKDERGTVFWYSDGGANELYFVDNGRELLDFHFSFLGHYLEAKGVGQLRYGLIVDEGGESLQIKPSAMVALTDEVPDGAVEAAVKILQNIDQLSAGHSDKIAAFLKK